MNEWRSEPPDSAGWWEWRRTASDEPRRVRIPERGAVIEMPAQLVMLGGKWRKADK